MTTLAAGTILAGTWRLVRPLGQGGMGVVWAAEHAQLGRTAALKFLRVEFAADEKSLLRFRQEAVAASRIGSPHIVGMLDSGTAPDGSPFLVMELLEGETLWEAMDGGAARLPVARAADILGQALTGVGAAHAQGIVHRDLKPENIFLTRLGERPDFVKLLDFGLARVRTGDAGTRLTQTGVLLGTPSYMAPEQILGAKDVDHRADLWALGVILFRCLTARRPFDGPTPADRIAAAVSRPPTPLRALRPELDETLATIVQRALARRPEQRFQTAEEFRAALAPYAAGCSSPYATSALAASFPPPVPASPGAPTAAVVAPSVPPSSPPHAPTCPEPVAAQLPPAGRPRRLWPWAVAALAVILAGAGVGWLVGRGGRDASGADPELQRLADREKFIRINLELGCPGPDGRTALQAHGGGTYYAFLKSVLRRYGMEESKYSFLSSQMMQDPALLAELNRRVLACLQPARPASSGAVPTAAADATPPPPPPVAGLPADPAAQRELFLVIATGLACAYQIAQTAGHVSTREEDAALVRRTIAEHGLSEADWAALRTRFISLWNLAEGGEFAWRVASCVEPGGMTALPQEPARLRELYATIMVDYQCGVVQMGREFGRPVSHEEGEELERRVCRRQGLTPPGCDVLMLRVPADPELSYEISRRTQVCTDRLVHGHNEGRSGTAASAPPDAASAAPAAPAAPPDPPGTAADTSSSPALDVHLH